MKGALKLTIADILGRTCFRDSEILAGRDGLNRVIKWVHIMEVTEIGQLLNGNELILTTGVGWKENQHLSFSFLKQLVEKKASGLCIELGTYTNIIPSKMIEFAEEHHFPLIVFRKEVRFIDITQDLNTLFIETHYKMMGELESFSNKLNHMLLSTDGFKRILRLLHTYLNVQVVYLPLEGEPQFVPLVDMQKQSEMLSDAEQMWINESERHPSKGRQMGMIAHQPIVALGHKFADLVIYLHSQEWTEFEALVMDRAATALAQDLLRVLYVEEKRKHKENQWAKKWLNGEHIKEEINQHLMALGPSFIPNGCVACVCRLNTSERKNDLTYYSMVLRSIIEQHGYFLLTVFDQNDMVLLLVNKRSKEDWKERLSQALEQLKRSEQLHERINSVNLFGVGKLFEDVSRMHESYTMARDVLSIQEKSGKRRTPFYEEMSIHRLLLLLDKQRCLQDWIEDYLGAILAYDALHKSNMMETLEVYFDVNGSKKEAADKLFIVRQTLYHRIERLKDLLGDDFMHTEKRLAIEFAIHAYKFLGKDYKQ